MKIRKIHTPNVGERKGGVRPDSLILHYTATATGDEAERLYLTSPDAAVSAHYMVDLDGTITQYVEEDKRAWHAGVSYWDGVTDLNSHSIGIEIVNPGHDGGYIDFGDEQMRAVIMLCQDVLSRHHIPPHRVLAHSDIAPDRKIDPGERFDWEKLAGAGVGLWPVPLKEDFSKAAALVYNGKRLRQALGDYGYDTRCDLKTLIGQFQRHFHPEIYKTPERVGQANTETVARLCALVRMKNSPNA